VGIARPSFLKSGSILHFAEEGFRRKRAENPYSVSLNMVAHCMPCSHEAENVGEAADMKTWRRKRGRRTLLHGPAWVDFCSLLACLSARASCPATTFTLWPLCSSLSKTSFFTALVFLASRAVSFSLGAFCLTTHSPLHFSSFSYPMNYYLNSLLYAALPPLVTV